MPKKNLTVREFRDRLAKFPDDMEVVISDGHLHHFYDTADVEITLFREEGHEYKSVVDIGIGGCSKSS